MSASDAEIVIVGGGLAGLAAAEALSRNGAAGQLRSTSDDTSAKSPCSRSSRRILILESKRRLGGRAGSFQDSSSGESIDYCQHVAMGCCTNFISLIRHCGLTEHVRRDQELTFLHPDHPPSRFAASRYLPPPLHLLGTINAQNYLSRQQKREIKRGLWKLMRCSSQSLQGLTATEWLEAAEQSAETRRAFWDVILVSALGERTDRVAMTAARKVLIDGFAAARGASDVLIPTLPLSELFGIRLADVLRQRGVQIQTETAVHQIHSDRTIETSRGIIRAEKVICALPWHSIGRLFEHWDAERSPIVSRVENEIQPIASIPSSPITGIHLWFDRSITHRKHCVMVGTTAQWIFREPLASSSSDASTSHQPGKGHATATAKGPAADPQRADSHSFYFQVVISASADLSKLTKKELLETVLGELRRAFPDARDATLVRSKIVTDPKSVFSVSPDVETRRPMTETRLPWLKLAGDWTATGWPATMEGAIISGRMAATQANKVADRPDAPSETSGQNHLEQNGANSASFVESGLPKGLLSRLLIRS